MKIFRYLIGNSKIIGFPIRYRAFVRGYGMGAVSLPLNLKYINFYILSFIVYYTFKCLSIFTFSTNPLGKRKERLGRSKTGFALWMMRWYEGERMMIFEVSLFMFF